MIVTTVGMKFLDNHHFNKNDIISLKSENNNRFDKNAIQVIVSDDHKGYLTKEDAIKVRQIPNFENKIVTFVQHFQASATLQIN